LLDLHLRHAPFSANSGPWIAHAFPAKKIPSAMKKPTGRGASFNPDNRFERLSYRASDDKFEYEQEVLDPEAQISSPRTEFLRDFSRSIISHNNSPDVGFESSINPYRGCEHGCAYCYARPTHEYLGMSAGIDFETKVVVKEDAPALLRKELLSKKWKPRTLAMSGVTDCYQPIERKLKLTRRCLEVLAEFRNPVALITKNHLITRDKDILADLAKDRASVAFLSVTTLDPELCAVLEPRTSRPRFRLQAVRELAEAGVPVGINIAPLIPGLTDHEIPAILKAAREAGAQFAGYGMLRLPHAVLPLFSEWLKIHRPERAEKVLHLLQGMRGGKLNDPRFGSRMTGEGAHAEQIEQLFALGCRREGLNRMRLSLSTEAFRRPGDQLSLF
jgi:DNA repair photolyase